MAMLDALPLLKLPSSWPLPVVATLRMAALAALDLVGAFAAKEWAEKQNTARPRPRRAVVPRALLGLRVVAAVRRAGRRHHGLDRAAAGRHPRHRPDPFDSSLPAGKLAAVVIILAAQGYLLLAPSGPTA